MAEAIVTPTAKGRETSSEKPVLVTREAGIFAVFVFGFCSIGLAYSGLLPFSTVAGVWPGSSLVGMLTVALILAMAHAYTYAIIGTIAPRYGADYVISSRVFGLPLAFASSWTLVIFLAIAGGILVSSIGLTILPMFIHILSLVTYDRTILDMISSVSSPVGVVTVGTAGVVLIFLIMILPPRVSRRILVVGFIMTLLGWGLICYQLLSAPTAGFPAAWEKFLGDGSFMGHLAQARSMGMQVNTNPGPMILSGLVLGFWMFFGYFAPTYIAGEVKKPSKNLVMGSWLSLLVSWGILALTTYLLQRLVPLEWLSAESYLSQSVSTSGAMPWLPLYAAVVQPNIVIIWSVGIAWLFSYLALVFTYLYSASRIVKAWGNDNIVPEMVAFVHPVLRSPLIAVLFIAIVAEIGVVVTALVGNVDSNINLVFVMACTQILPVLSITVLPFVRRDLYEKADPMVRRKIGRVPVISLVGGLSMGYLIWMIITTLAFPEFQKLNSDTLLIFAGLFGLALAWYFIRWFYLKRQGIKLGLETKQLPEE